MTGKAIRLRKLFKHSQRLLIVPMDHGITIGPVQGLVDIAGGVKAVAEGGADAVVVHQGLVRHLTEYLTPTGCELIVHLAASTALSPTPNRKELVSSVEHAIRLGATAISSHVNLGGEFEPQMLRDLGVIARECDLWGMPLLAMMYVRDGSKESEYDPVRIKHAARVAEEVGADIIKVYYTGSPETFAEITGSVRVPVVIAGGPKMDSAADLLAMISDSIKAGGGGVSIGRNVFQAANPTQLTKEIRQLLDQQI